MRLHRWLAGVSSAAALLLLAGAVGRTPTDEAIRRIRSAQMLEQLGDSARARELYLGVVADLPDIADWLRLRVAALLRDSAERRALYDQVRTPAVRGQISRTEAAIRESLGDYSGAIQLRLASGDFHESIRLRLRAAPDSAARAPALRDGLTLLNAATGSTVVRVVALLAPYSRELLPADHQLLARRAGSERSPSAPELFTRASLRGIRLSETDRFLWGRALFEQGHYRQAVLQFERVTQGPLATQARYERGRALIRAGRSAEGRRILERLVASGPRDTAVGAAALLLGDLRRDAGDYAGARSFWLQSVAAAPLSSSAPRARFMAALVLWQLKQYQSAAREWDSLSAAHPSADEGIAAGYWSGRAWSRVGRPAEANQRWERVSLEAPLSYYAGLSLRQLGRTRAGFASRFDSAPPLPELAAAGRRLDLLRQAQLTREARIEQQWVYERAGDSPERLLITGQLLAGSGAIWSATQLGWRAWRQAGPDAAALRLIFPLRYADTLTGAAMHAGVDPVLVAALIRQESVFDTGAVSRAGARGLMQVMPSLGRSLARSRGIKPWHSDSLFNPNRNLELGTLHLSHVVRQHRGLPLALAAYNAGSSRVQRWIRTPGADDPEAFVEWIPFSETRGYVKTVLRNFELYRQLYPELTGTATP